VLAITSRKIEMQSDPRASDIKGRGSSPIRPKDANFGLDPAKVGAIFFPSALCLNSMRLAWIA
jgi:hypothetical protein